MISKQAREASVQASYNNVRAWMFAVSSVCLFVRRRVRNAGILRFPENRTLYANI